MAVKIDDTHFNSYLDEINVHDYKSKDDNVDYAEKLVQSVLKLTQFSGDNNSIIVPVAFRKKKSSLYSNIDSCVPSHEKASSLAEVLFSQDVPIVSVVSDYLNVTHATSSRKRDKIVSWVDVVNSLLNEIDIYDGNKNKINPSSIVAIESAFINDSNTSISSKEIRGFQETLGDYLSQYFHFDYDNKKAKVIDRDFLKVNSSTAQRSITPFVFNNCKQACRFCYVDRGLSTIKYPHNWCRKLDDIDNVLNDFDDKTGI